MSNLPDQPPPDLDPSDPYARAAQTFPQLSAKLAARVAAYSKSESLAEGTLLFERGQRSVDFFLVQDGSVEIFELDAQGVRNVVTVHGPREFTGELDIANYEKFEGQGIYYAATAMEAQLCSGEEVSVVGGGNSAGQAAVFLSRSAAQRVHVLVRADGLAATVSDYLVQHRAIAENHPASAHRDHRAPGR